MAASFPAERLEGSLRVGIESLLAREGRQGSGTRVAIGFCHWSSAEGHVLWAGFRAALQAACASAASGGVPQPCLMFGLHSTERIRCAPESRVLDWPGVAYLRYDASEAAILAAVDAILDGVQTPIPSALLPTAKDVLLIVSELRHWLEGRLNITEGALMDFRNAAPNGAPLVTAHLEPAPAITARHRQLLDRLWALEATANAVAAEIGGLAPIKGAIAEFEARWDALERARAVLRAGGTDTLEAASSELAGACAALAAAIEATRSLTKSLAAADEA